MKSNRQPLSGKSGYDLYVYTNPQSVKIVHKQAPEIELNARLQQQKTKQLYFSQQSFKLFSTPKIVNEGFDQGQYFFEYEYIEGVPLVLFIDQQSVQRSKPLIERLIEIIKQFKMMPHSEKVIDNSREMFQSKIVTNCQLIPNSSKLQRRLLDQLEKLELNLPATLCHGDLSFDNIIVDQHDQLWLIDHLGSFYPHYWLDLVKLYQDIEGGWCMIKHGIMLSSRKAQLLTDFVNQQVAEFDPEYLKVHYFLMALTFLRIVPYLDSATDASWAMELIEHYSTMQA